MPEPSSCERCGIQFGCGAADEGCWCARLAVPPPVRRELLRRYRACLCPTCLGELAAAGAPLSGAVTSPAAERALGACTSSQERTISSRVANQTASNPFA
jgi:hypothetical protein